MRGEGAGGGGARAPAGDISDDDSSSDNDDGRATLNVGPKAKAIAKQWLQVCGGLFESQFGGTPEAGTMSLEAFILVSLSLSLSHKHSLSGAPDPDP